MKKLFHKRKNIQREHELLLDMIEKAQNQLNICYNICHDNKNVHLERAKRCYDLAIIQAKMKHVKCPRNRMISKILFFSIPSKN